MSANLIGLVTLIYLGVAVSLLLKDGRIGMAICFVGYSLANIGLIIDVMKWDSIIAGHLGLILDVAK